MIAFADQETITSERIQELQKTVSATRLNSWQRCRLQFFFRYVLQIKKPPTPALHVGKVVHAVLQAWNLARWRKESLDQEKFKDIFTNEWQEQQKDIQINWEDQEAEQRTAWTLVDLFLKDPPIPINETPEAVEVQVEADLSRKGLPKLIGIIDLVRAGRRIVDFKTSGQTPDREKAAHQNETQLTSYSVLYKECTGYNETGLELHHLVKLKNPKLVVTTLPPATEGQKSKLFRIMESYQRGLEHQDFIPSPGLHCFGCEFFNECRRWS